VVTNMNVSIRYSTHLPVLLEAIKRTTGDVLELGPGVFSTPVLHWLTETQRRRMLTIETDPNWMYFCMKYYRTSHHKFLQVKNWDEAKDVISKPWDVALVDHSPSERRIKEIEILAPFAKYIIVHDADDKGDSNYHFSTIKSLFKYYWRFERIEPQTAVYSNLVDLSDFKVYA
jgi:hypothetical protein